MSPRLLALILALAALPLALRATSVVPPTFPELVREAEAIYRGQVTAVEARRLTRPDGSTVIKTFVTLAIDRVLKGGAPTEVTLEFLGGKVGEESLVIAGMPAFALGQREFVFVQKNGRQFCPLVGLMHGRYRILRDASGTQEFVARDNGAPLTDLAQIALPQAVLPPTVRAASAAAAAAGALSPAAFEASIAAEVQRPTPRARPN